VLQKHWPHVKQYEIKELNYERLKADGIKDIDIITGGYPCQPFSVAGRKKGEQDERHLWPEYLRLIQELRPSFVIGENVGGHIKLGLDTVLTDLESEGYATTTFSISASSIGANHQLGIAAKLVAKAESKNMKLTKRILVDDLKMIKLNLMLLQDDITRQSK
jgi:DNA (cytosine-5)-methyltransferase 1